MKFVSQFCSDQENSRLTSEAVAGGSRDGFLPEELVHAMNAARTHYKETDQVSSSEPNTKYKIPLQFHVEVVEPELEPIAVDLVPVPGSLAGTEEDGEEEEEECPITNGESSKPPPPLRREDA